MRINIEIDEGLMREATRLSGVRTEKAAVEAGLRLLVETHAQKAIRRLRGKVRWEGDLAVSRRGRLCSLSILLLLVCSLYSRAQTATSNAKAAADLVPITLDMDWTRGRPDSHYGPNFIWLHTPCRSTDQSCECVAEFSYMEGPKFEAVVLPYGQSASMYVFLPAEDSSLKELEQTLSAKNWQEWLSQFGSRVGMVGLPKFKTETGFDVRAALQELGVKRIFAQFAALLGLPLQFLRRSTYQRSAKNGDQRG